MTQEQVLIPSIQVSKEKTKNDNQSTASKSLTNPPIFYRCPSLRIGGNLSRFSLKEQYLATYKLS